MEKYFTVKAGTKFSNPDDPEIWDMLNSFTSIIDDLGLGCCGVMDNGKMDYSVMENTETMAKWVNPKLPGENLAEAKEALRKYMEHCGDFENIEIGEIVEG